MNNKVRGDKMQFVFIFFHIYGIYPFKLMLCLLRCDHEEIFAISFSADISVFSGTNKVQSSPYLNIRLACPRVLLSLTYVIKAYGPIADPCTKLILLVMSIINEENPLSLVDFDLSVRKDIIHLTMFTRTRRKFQFR